MELDRTERRILGSLIEKRWTTPDQYPLTLNALVAAVNQKSNRNPVMQVHDFEVEGALLALREEGLVLIREREGGRTTRYAERLSEELAVGRKETAVLAELMLRGPQAPGELARRAKRMSSEVDTPEKTEAVLKDLAESRLVRLLPRRPRERYARWGHRLAPESEREEEARAEPEPEPEPREPKAPKEPPARDALAELRARVEELEARVRALEGREEPDRERTP